MEQRFRSWKGLSLFAVGPIAQSVEQRTFNPWVDGSSPSGPTFTIYFKSEFTFP